LKRRVLRDLRVELPARSKAQHGLVTRLLLERGSDFLGRLGEIGSDGDVGLGREGIAFGEA